MLRHAPCALHHAVTSSKVRNVLVVRRTGLRLVAGASLQAAVQVRALPNARYMLIVKSHTGPPIQYNLSVSLLPTFFCFLLTRIEHRDGVTSWCRYVGDDTTVVMLGSIVALCVGRIAAIQATELTQVYLAFGPVAMALGVVNTGITNAGKDCTIPCSV